MMRVNLIDYTEDASRKIAEAAGVCYASEGDWRKRIKAIMRNGHYSCLSFANATFRIEGVSRACSHQLVRHAHLRYLQESQRYVRQDNAACVVPRGLDGAQRLIFDDAVEHARQAYRLLVACGCHREDARLVLPAAATTALVVTGNFQGWRDFLALRLSDKAQLEIRNVAKLIHLDLACIAPEVFG